MNELLIASVVVLWIVVVALVFLGVALARQIGVLHTRLAPAGALMSSAGPAVGSAVGAVTVDTLAGTPAVVGGSSGNIQLILFVSPSCPICKTLVPTARSMSKSDSRLQLMFASDGGELEQHHEYVQAMGIANFPYVVSLDLGMKFEVGKLPYAVLIDAEGVLRSKGLVNSREHLESLVEAMDTGHASIQDYLVASGELEHRPS